MAMLVDDLEPHIRQVILATPPEQLGTITARSVREQLVASIPGVSKDWVKANKSTINELIGTVFEQLVPPADDPAAPTATHTHAKAEPEDDGGPSTLPTHQHAKKPAPTASNSSKSKTPNKKNHVLTDEEYARRLSAELNGHVSRSSRSGKVPNAARAARNNARGSGSAKKAKKSAERVVDSDASDDDDDGGEDGSGADERRRTRAKPKKGKRTAAKGDGGGSAGGAKGGFQKEYILSAPLSALLEVDRLSRPQVVKQLWAYIKEHELQNPSNKREILCDDRLRLVFISDKIDMFKMNKVLGQHLHEEE